MSARVISRGTGQLSSKGCADGPIVWQEPRKVEIMATDYTRKQQHDRLFVESRQSLDLSGIKNNAPCIQGTAMTAGDEIAREGR